MTESWNVLGWEGPWGWSHGQWHLPTIPDCSKPHPTSNKTENTPCLILEMREKWELLHSRSAGARGRGKWEDPGKAEDDGAEENQELEDPRVCGLAENVDQQDMEQPGMAAGVGGWQGRGLKLKPAAGTGIGFPNSWFNPEFGPDLVPAAEVWLEAEFVLPLLRENQNLCWSPGVKDLEISGIILTGWTFPFCVLFPGKTQTNG